MTKRMKEMNERIGQRLDIRPGTPKKRRASPGGCAKTAPRLTVRLDQSAYCFALTRHASDCSSYCGPIMPQSHAAAQPFRKRDR
jgi:hypothetical protein